MLFQDFLQSKRLELSNENISNCCIRLFNLFNIFIVQICK